MDPIFLFDMGCHLFCRAATGELDFILITEGLEMVVDKF
jgi:hypothetical protein